MLVAPALAGVLTGAFGLWVPLFVDAASYLALVVAAVLIRTRRGGARTVAAGQAAAVAGPAEPAPAWRLRADPLLFTMVVMAASAIAATSAVNVADVFLVRMVLHSTATMYGLLTAVWTGAAMIGGWLLARHDRRDAGISVAMLGALGVVCAAVLAMGLVPSLVWLVPIFLVGGVGNGMLNVSAGALLSRRTPPESRGHGGRAVRSGDQRRQRAGLPARWRAAGRAARAGDRGRRRRVRAGGDGGRRPGRVTAGGVSRATPGPGVACQG